MLTPPGFTAPAKDSELSPSYLNALLNPEMVPHGFPILGTGNIKQALVDPTFHRVVKNLEKLCPDERLGATQPGEEGWLEFRSQLAARQRLIPEMEGGTWGGRISLEGEPRKPEANRQKGQECS